MMPQTTLVTRDTPLPAGWRYSVMRKVAMAISGLALVAFLFGHFVGNTVLLSGEAAFNDYLLWLQNHPLIHYGVWVVIATALLAHLAVGPHHWMYNRRARPVRYRRKKNQESTWAGRSMMISGTLLLLFVVVHLAHVRGYLSFTDTVSVYQNLRAGFTHWWVVVFYLVAQLALALHLYHGLWSQFQTLGIHHPGYNYLRVPIAVLIALGIAFLNSALVLLNTEAVIQLLERLL